MSIHIKKDIRRRWLPLGFVSLFAVLGAYLLITSHAATPLQPSVSWTSKGKELVNVNSGLCLGISQTTKAANGTKLLLEDCNAENNNQKWNVAWGSGTVRSATVVNGFGQCLDDTLGSTTAGTPIQLWTCIGKPASQSWSTGYGDGTIRIQNLCLGVNGNAKTAGAAVVLSACYLPTPSVSITAPGGGATVSGSKTNVSAAASVSSASISNITIAINGSTLATCTKTTTCSRSWNTTTVQNGTYTITANTTASDGVSAQTTQSVVVHNSKPPSPGGQGSQSQGGSTTGNFGSDISGSDTSGGSSTFGGVSTSNGSSSVSANGSNSNGSSTTSTTHSGSSTSSGSGKPTHTAAKHKTSFLARAGIVFSIFILLAAIAALIIFLRRKRQMADGNLPQVETQNLPVYPLEDSATSAARLDWWLPESERQKIASNQPLEVQKPATDEPPDMFEEGRKRLEEEEKRRQLGQ